jgi:hypothetical protein
MNTPVAGSFKPGSGSGASICCPAYVDAFRFLNKNDIWWPQPAPGGYTSATIASISGVDFTQTPAVFEVLGGSHLNTPWCTPLPGSPTFPVTRGEQYQFIIYFTQTAPPAGQTITFVVEWQS